MLSQEGQTKRLHGIFKEEGQIAAVSGNTPFLLSGRDRVWMVLSGSLEVFAAKCRGNQISGRKEHYFSASEGQCLFGMEWEKHGLGQGFQAVGLPGTLVSSLSLARLQQLAASGECKDEIAAVIDAWVDGLTRGLTKDIIPRPKPDLQVAPGQELTVSAQKIVYPLDRVGWVRLLDGSFLFIGMEEIQGDSLLVPLCTKSWIQALTDCRIAFLDSKTALEEGRIWTSLDAFYQLVFHMLVLNSGLAAADDYNLLQEKTKADTQASEAGLADLAGVMIKQAFSLTGLVSDDRAFAVCSLVGEQLNVEVKPPSRKRRRAERAASVEEILRNSRLNSRRVMLKDRWWKEQSGPLIGFMKADEAPVALLPARGRRYRLVDPIARKTRIVDAAVAGQLSPMAVMVYRPLGEGIVSVRQLIRFALKGSRADLQRALTWGLIIGVCNLVIPIVTGMIFENIIPEAQRYMLLQIVLILVAFCITNLLFEVPRNMALLRVETRASYDLEAGLWDRLLRLPIPFFKEHTAGNLAMRGMGVTFTRQMIATSGLLPTTVGFLFTLLNVPLLFYYQWDLAIIACAALIIAAAVVLFLQLRQAKSFREMVEIQGTLSGTVLQFVTAISKLRVAGAENRAFRIWARDFSRQKKLSFRGGQLGNLQMTFVNIFPLATLMAIFAWIGLAKEDPASLKTGDFMAFNAAWGTLAGAVVQMVTSAGVLAMVAPFWQRMNPILEAQPEVDVHRTDPGELVGRIETCHVFFRYTSDGPMVLKDISMRVEPGEFIAIVGPSGSGKSTLLRLLLGFERPTSGAIYYDDQDLAEMDLNGIRRNMGVVMQGANLMPGTILMNIIGSRPLGVDDAWEAARMAGLEDDIKAMPMELHTFVSEGATTLSGGQRQRLMIARAIVNRPRILIFDEATAALDNRTQAIVANSLKRLKSTRIVIAHRLSTVEQADRIFVLDRGEQVEVGNYQELMRVNGLFARMARRQIL